MTFDEPASAFQGLAGIGDQAARIKVLHPGDPTFGRCAGLLALGRGRGE